ncbi:MAG: zinc-ribbon domain-containing protein [Magnetococcales bacterium]|nr:zinc-ribbon domain-containing protein [Magnetococcales bacterium]
MVVQCDKCGSRFDVAASLLGTTGRKLKCSRCKQVFFQPPVADEPEAELEPQLKEDPDFGDVDIGTSEQEPDLEQRSEPDFNGDDFDISESDLEQQLAEESGEEPESDDDLASELQDLDLDSDAGSDVEDAPEIDSDEEETDDFSLDSLLAGTEDQSVDFTIDPKDGQEPEPEENPDLAFDDITLDDFDPDELTGLKEEESDDLLSSSRLDEEDDPLAGLALSESSTTPQDAQEASNFFSDNSSDGTKSLMDTTPELASSDEEESQQPGRSFIPMIEKGLWAIVALLVVAGTALLAWTQKDWVEYKLYDMQNPIRLETVSSRWRASLSGGKILVVEGKINNTTSTSHNPRMVRVALLDRNQQVLQDNSAIPDRILSDQDLSSSESGLKAMIALQRNPQRMEVKKLNAGRVAPFQVVFLNPPNEAYSYRVDLEEVSATPSKWSTTSKPASGAVGLVTNPASVKEEQQPKKGD